MKFFRKAKDGGPKSTVTGYWLLEIKSLFSIVLLRFDNGSRSAYHSHAFNSLNWVLRGQVYEEHLLRWPTRLIQYRPSFRPVLTWRGTFHRVVSNGTTWVLSLRGPWAKTWREYDPDKKTFTTLTHGRRQVSHASQ